VHALPTSNPHWVARSRSAVGSWNEGTSVRAAAKELRYYYATLYRALDAVGSQALEAR